MHSHPVLKKIISGGQTGADRAALDFAIAQQIPHGGWCPCGRISEDGTIDMRYRLKETPSSAYAERTEWNVRDSDATIIFNQPILLGGGTRLTAEFARMHQKPWLHISKDNHAQAAELIEKFMVEHRVQILNVAGPRAATDPNIITFTQSALIAWWKHTHDKKAA